MALLFKIQFECDNDAFANGKRAAEIARILKDVRQAMLNGIHRGKIRDVNGNTIGAYGVDGKEIP